VPNYHTAAGVHPKMSLREVEQNYGKLKEILLSEIESREYATFADQPDGIQLRVMDEKGMAGVYRDGQNRTTRYAPLCVAKNMSKGDVFVTSPCKIVTSDPRPKPAPAAQPKPAPIPAKNYTLRVCNTTGATVQFALGYYIERTNWVGQGWWLVCKDSCMNIDMSEVWKPQGL